MRGDTTTESEVEEHGGSAAAAGSASLERRSSLVKLQFMLKKVTQSPFHQDKDLDSSTCDSSGSVANESQNKQDRGLLGDPSAAAADATDNHWLDLGKNGLSGGLARSNPFYTHYLDSSSNGHVMEAAERKTSELDFSSVFAPPPGFQSSPLDLHAEIKPVKNGGQSSEPQKDLFPAPTSSPHLLMSPLTRNATAAAGGFNDVTLSSLDLFKPASAPTRNLAKDSQLESSDLFKDEGLDLFRAAEREDLLRAERTREGNLFDADPFTSPSNKKDDPFQSPQPVVTNPFHTTAAIGSDLFQAVPAESGRLLHKRPPPKYEDAISPSSENAANPFSSTIPRDLFHDFSSSDDPFSTTPSKQYEPFKEVSNGTPDIFQPYSSKTNSKDVFEITPRSAASVAAYSKPSLSGPLEMKTDTLPSSSDLFKATPSKSHPAEPSSNKPLDAVLTTPQKTQHNILQPTPFTRARNLSMSLSQSPPEMAHVSTFKRPPKPLPRTRPPRKEKPPVPEKPSTPENPTKPEPALLKTSPKPAFRPLQNPVTQRKSKTPDNKPLEPDNYVVFQDILLIGQEKCVEDWPEDSPELNPDFKPSGKLRLRRESLKMKMDSDGGSGEDQDGAGGHGKKKDKKFRMSLLSRRGSKEKNIYAVKEAKSGTLPARYKSSKVYVIVENSTDPLIFPVLDHSIQINTSKNITSLAEEFSDLYGSTGETEDWEQNGVECKKKLLKTKVNQLLRRGSTISSVPEGKFTDGHSHQESKGTAQDDSTGDEEEEGKEAQYNEADGNGFKKTKKMKIKFVPQRGFAITVEKTEELKGAHGYTPRKGSKDDAFEDVEELKGHSLQSTSKAAFMDEGHFQKTHHMSAGLNGDEYPYVTEDCKPKKPTKVKLLHMGRRSSKEDMLSNPGSAKKKSSFSAEELDDDELNGMEDCKLKKPKRKGFIPTPRKSTTTNEQSDTIGFSHRIPRRASNEAVAEDGITQTRKAFMSPEDMYDSQHGEPEACKPKKPLKLKGLKKHKAKSKAMSLEYEAPPGATSADYLSEAAKAEWLAAQMDERAIADLEDEDEEGDTDSLMEWWNTVEQWDEVPSDYEDKVIKEDECKSFTILADKVHRGLRVFNKVFTERAEVLWQSVISLHAIADKISDFHQKAKIAGITGGTTTAVGGVTAIAGLALAPFTFGASLVITAVGVGVATAGGITSASAAISDNVNNMHDRKKVEIVLEEYEAHLLDIGKILHFVNQGLYKLRGHPFLRSGTQHYSEDWEIRRAVQMISLVDTPVMRAVDITDSAIASVQGLFNGMDKYFLKDSRELKKGCKTEVVGQIKEVANGLNDGIVALNAIREELQDATGNI